MPSTDSLTAQLQRLSAFEPVPFPVISLYLNTQPGQHGRDQHHAFIRKEFKARSRTYGPHSSERESLDRYLDRISRYLDTELQPSSNSGSVFACSAADLFETVQMAAPIDRHWLHVGDRPHLYPLARLESQYPRYAAVITDTNAATILVIAAGAVVEEHEINNVKTRWTSQGGWSQARYQRHIVNFHQQHAKEVVEALDRIVRAENIDHVVLSCDEVSLPLLRAQLPKHLEGKIVDNVRLEAHASADAIVRRTQEAMRRVNERTDREKVEGAIGAYRAGSLGVVGPEDTLAALLKGQVDELLITASIQQMQRVPVGQTIGSANDAVLAEPAVQTVSAGEAADSAPEVLRLADELIAKAKQTAAKITFVEDPELLKDYGGVAALLRFTI
jgi:peptide chain release factor subunit 1